MAAFSSYWGKALQEDEEGAAFHPYSYHSLDVVAVAMRWLCESRSLSQRFFQLGDAEESVKAWLWFFLALHDFGKLDHRFQCKALHVLAQLAPDRLEIVSGAPAGSRRYDHGSDGYRWALKELPIYLGFGEDEEQAVDAYDLAWKPWLAAVTGHHGVLPRDTQPPNVVTLPPALRQLDREARRAWIKKLETMFLLPVGLSLRVPPPPVPELLAGFCSVADWLGSNAAYFPYMGAASIDLADHLEERQESAAAILRDSGLVSRTLSVGGMKSVFPDRRPWQVQTLIDELPPVPGLTLIEAPTGSGKTEAALAYAGHLLAHHLADSIVFALPTQATANAMLYRVEAVASRLFPGADANIVLAHGKARYNPDFIALQEAASRKSAQSSTEAMVQCASWLSQSRKRAFLGQIGVCTIDQALLGVLPVRHNFVRQFGIGRSVLIVDEVHAYDSYMYGLLEEVLRRQRRAGGSAILLSATLPHFQRSRLVAAWADFALVIDSPYPLITHVSSAGTVIYLQPNKRHLPPPRTINVELEQTPQALPADHLCLNIIAAARRGTRVAIICNLVDHAQMIARQLRYLSSDIPVDLLHARYRFCDRQRRETQVLAAYGRSHTAHSGRILVATQVIEQSVDLDFDWLITQLCPADLLFQRLGRLHRHTRPRPDDFSLPRAHLLIPQEEDFGPHALIYDNVRALWRTQRLLHSTTEIHFPEAYREWIEQVYTDEDWPDEPDHITEAANQWKARQIAARSDAFQLVNHPVGTYADEDSRIQFLTRDGHITLNVLPLSEGKLLDGSVLEAYPEWERAELIDQHTVPVPESWKRFLPDPVDGIHRLPMHADGNRWVVDLDGVRLTYSESFGMERHLL